MKQGLKSNIQDKQYVASISYGKDSLAMLHVITDVLHWKLDRIITADVWATDTIPADLPPMVEFKDKADRIIKERWGVEVEHFCAMKPNKQSTQTYDDVFYKEVAIKSAHQTYENLFYKVRGKGNRPGQISGFPMICKGWCTSELKRPGFNIAYKQCTGAIAYVGIAADEGKRTERHKAKVERGEELLPLVEAGWTEQMCREWCEQNELLAPTYTDFSRGGCWFCHNQGVDSLRLLRKNYPDLWALLLKWDSDSPVTFKADGHTVHDFEKRFQWEDEGYLPMQKQFRWDDVESPQMNIYQFVDTE